MHQKQIDPNSAQAHAANCEHFEIPPGLSGLSQVMGSAIKENVMDQCIDLKFDFVLSKLGSRPPITKSEQTKDSVTANPNRLTLRGLLHYLWEEAGFNRWVPKMAGKRSWYVVRKHLLGAAEGKRSAAGSLAELLYLPEVYEESRKQVLLQKRLALLASAAQSTSKGQKLMLVIGVYDRIEAGSTINRLFLENAPDFPLLLEKSLYTRLVTRFGAEMGLIDFHPSAKLIVIATLWVDISGVSRIDQFSCMAVTSNWIPFEDTFEHSLFDSLTTQERYFIRGMRYNLGTEKALASCMLTDCEPPIALLLQRPKQSDEMPDIPFEVWKWNVLGGNMPALPQRRIEPPLAR